MTITSVAAYLRGLEFFSDVVERVSLNDWQRPSPCEGWRALDVLGHVGEATSMGPAILRGEPTQMAWPDPPGEGVEGDPAQWWRSLMEPARQAVSEADLDAVVDSPMGPRAVRDGLAFPAVDLFIHAWDLACSIGIAHNVEIPDDIIDFSYRLTDSIPEDVLRNPGIFGPAVPPSPEATRSQALLAWMGRDPLC